MSDKNKNIREGNHILQVDEITEEQRELARFVGRHHGETFRRLAEE